MSRRGSWGWVALGICQWEHFIKRFFDSYRVGLGAGFSIFRCEWVQWTANRPRLDNAPHELGSGGGGGISRALALLANAMTHALINVEWNTLLNTLLSLSCVGVFQSLPSWNTIFISLHNFVIKILAQFSLSTLPKCNKRQGAGEQVWATQVRTRRAFVCRVS